MRIKLFIVIVSYNGMEWISRCLSSCLPYEVIVVDNNSRDGTASFIKEKFPEVTLLQQERNLGFGAANNIGISYALKEEADYVFLLNQDAYLDHNTVEELIKIHKKNNVYGILTPIHLNGDGTTLDYNFSKYIVQNKKLQFDALKQNFTLDIYPITFVNAAAWLLPRNTLKTVGGFDPIFYHYSEDINYCQRVLFHNFQIGVVPQVYAFHDRENRKKPTPVSADDILRHFEHGLKQNWANINEDIESDVGKIKKSIFQTIIKLVLKLKFKTAGIYINKYRLIKSLLPEIRESRKINKETGLHYLED